MLRPILLAPRLVSHLGGAADGKGTASAWASDGAAAAGAESQFLQPTPKTSFKCPMRMRLAAGCAADGRQAFAQFDHFFEVMRLVGLGP